MISVLIPVYNCEVVSLVNELKQQLGRLSIEGEIIVLDDCSSLSFRQLNRQIINLSNVIYKELDRNYGRTAIRQLLAGEAKYEWLLFLDSDSRIIHPDFLQRYTDSFEKGFDVYTGGRVYPAKPIECNKQLHWKYGTKRESVKGNKTAFHTNNFCIRKEIFQQLNFPEFLRQYGYEDIWMDLEFDRLNKEIIHIGNAVEHIQIEGTKAFLRKTEQALQNLLLLETVADKNIIAKNVSLFKTYCSIKKMRLGFAVKFFYHFFEKKILQNLNSCNPSLFFFDCYRLGNLIYQSEDNKD